MTGGGLAFHWALVGGLIEIAAALSALLAAALIFGHRQRFGEAGRAIVVSLGLTALWCLAIAAAPLSETRQGLFESLANLGWLLVVFRLFAGDGRHASLAPIRPFFFAVAFVECLHLGLEIAAPGPRFGPAGAEMVLHLTVVLRLLVIIGGLVLLHNLYGGASVQARPALRWPALALATLWGFELNLYAIAYFVSGWPGDLAALRGLAVIALSILLVVGSAQGSEQLRFRPSRRVTFQSASLLIIGAYLAGMYLVTRWLTFAGGDFARLIQFGFLITAVLVLLVVLPSRRLRGWIRVTLVKHLFQHRYDYRAEWMRFTRTMGRGEDDAPPLEQRAIQAIADIADSPAGMLLVPDDNGGLMLAAQWNWAAAQVPGAAMASAAIAFFEASGRIVDLDDVRVGKGALGESAAIPEWLMEEQRAWTLIPLLHFDRLTGVVVLARANPPRRFDWEDFDLLRIAGRQLASYLAEHASQAALAEAGRFDDFHRRIAFVMHDIKNLASQLSLLARNAELHADNPAFRADMLVTLRNSADKLNTLLSRLSRYGGSGAERLGDVDAAEVLRAVAAQFREQHLVLMSHCEPAMVTANRESLEQVLVHLVQNAIDASGAHAPVVLGVVVDGVDARIDIVDSGSGMSPEFLRTRLFKPFVSSKPGGFGIGAFEARELVRAMRGRLDVESREGLGTRFTISLPLAGTSRLAGNEDAPGLESGRKVA